MKVSLFIPTLNEIEGVKAIMPRVKREWFDEVIIVDGNSTDGTREYLESLGYSVLSQTVPNLMGAWWQGFQAATGDVIVLFSPDGNSIPELLPALIKKMREGYDMVTVSRYKDDAKSEDDDLLSKLGNGFFTGMINLLFRSHYTDVLVIFRGFKKELLTSFHLTKDSGAQFNPTRLGIYELFLCIGCAKQKKRVAEIAGDELHNIGRNESRAFKNNYAKIAAAFTVLYHIVRERISS